MAKKYRIGLIDDEENILDILIQEIAMIPGFQLGFSTVDPFLGLEYARDKKADILITDIMMPELGGLELSRKLIDSGIPIIICSGHSRYAIPGYKVDALGFLTKPPDPIELADFLEKARKKIDPLYQVVHEVAENYRVVGDKLKFHKDVVKLSEILYIEQQNKWSTVKLADGTRFTLASSFLDSLNRLQYRYLVRVHQSFAVNVLKVRKLLPGGCELESGDRISISRRYRDDVKRIFENR